MAIMPIDYERLPQLIKDNLTAKQWKAAQGDIIPEDQPVPDTAQYINIKNGQIHEYESGTPAPGPLLPVHDLSGGHGKDSTQFQTTPRGAHP